MNKLKLDNHRIKFHKIIDLNLHKLDYLDNHDYYISSLFLSSLAFE